MSADHSAIFRNLRVARELPKDTDSRSVPWADEKLTRFIEGPLSLCGWIAFPALIAFVMWGPV